MATSPLIDISGEGTSVTAFLSGADVGDDFAQSGGLVIQGHCGIGSQKVDKTSSTPRSAAPLSLLSRKAEWGVLAMWAP